MSVPRWLVAAHVAASAGILGADLALLALGWHGLAGAEPGSVYPAMHTISAWLLRPAALLVMATGLAAAVRSGSLGEAWVLVKLAVTLALTALVVLVAEPGLADAVADGASISDRTRTTYGVVPVATAVLLLLNVSLGVYRPRQPWSPRWARSRPDRRVVDINQKFDLFSEHWSPKLVASLNDYEVKLVKIKGEFVWHTHEDTDELFRWSMANSPSNSVIVTSSSDPVSCSWYHVELSIAPARTMRSRRCSSSQPEWSTPGRPAAT